MRRATASSRMAVNSADFVIFLPPSISPAAGLFTFPFVGGLFGRFVLSFSRKKYDWSDHLFPEQLGFSVGVGKKKL